MHLQDGTDGHPHFSDASDETQLKMIVPFSSHRFEYDDSGSCIYLELVIHKNAIFILTPTGVSLPLTSLCIGSFNFIWIGFLKYIFHIAVLTSCAFFLCPFYSFLSTMFFFLFSAILASFSFFLFICIFISSLRKTMFS